MSTEPGGRAGRFWLAAILWVVTAAGVGVGLFFAMRAWQGSAPGGRGEVPGGKPATEAEFRKCLAEFQAAPDDAARLERLVRVAARTVPAPAVGGEAERRYANARRLFESAETVADIDAAIGEYRAALGAAPWWPEPRRDLGLALVAAQRREEALVALKLFLVARPEGPEARAVREALGELAEGETGAEADEPTATCRIGVPMYDPEYWLFIDGWMASAPPHDELASDYSWVSEDGGWTFSDREGRLVKVNILGFQDYARSGAKEKAFFFQDFDLAPGRHKVELLMLNNGGFPFVISTAQVDLKTEKAQELRLWVPANISRMPRAMASPIWAFPIGDWQGSFDARQKFLKGRMTRWATDPVAVALSEALVGARLKAPDGPVVMVELPKERGGPREVDAKLAKVLVNYLESEYLVDKWISDFRPDAPRDYRDAMGRLSQLAAAHNERVSALRELVTILEKAAAAADAEENE